MRFLFLLPAALRLAAAQAPSDSLLIRALAGARAEVAANQCGLGGAGGRAITSAAATAQFTVLGEAHGLADVPKFTAALFCDLAPAGYRHLVIEVSPPVGKQLERSAKAGGVHGVRAFGEKFFPGAPFYMLEQEAELLASVTRSKQPAQLWGIDYDVATEGFIGQRIAELAPGPQARAFVEMTRRTYAAALAEKNPGKVFAFAGVPDSVAKLRSALAPRARSELDTLLSLIDGTIRINQEWLGGRAYSSNVMRSDNLRRNFAAAYREMRRRDSLPRAVIKLGAAHSYRGRNPSNTYDVGSLAPEIAALGGSSAVGILLVGGATSQQALFSPTTFDYAPAANVYGGAAWMRPFFALADTARWTAFDLRGLRAAASTGALGPLSPATVQAIFGFDFLVVLGGSRPSTPFALTRPNWAREP